MARKKELTIPTRLGVRRVDPDKIIYFPRGLAGFEGLHEFVLLQIRPDAPLLILQSVDKADVGLLVGDPFSFMKDFKMRVGDAEQKLLRLKDVRQTAVLVTVTIPNGKPEETRLNLTGPILINHEARIGLQIPQADDNMPAQVLLQNTTNVQEKPQNKPVIKSKTSLAKATIKTVAKKAVKPQMKMEKRNPNN